MAVDIDSVVRTIDSVVGAADRPVALHEPEFSGEESSAVEHCLRTTHVSTTRPLVERFEAALAHTTGARHAVATVNGTAALHIALIVAGVQPDDEVLTPALTFVAAANAARSCGAVPHFVDTDPGTFGIDADRLSAYLERHTVARNGRCTNRRTGRRLAAFLPMHTFGHPVDLDPLLEMSARFGIPIIEEAAQAIGSTYKDRHVGTIAPIGVLSFNGNKIVTTGGGGALLMRDDATAGLAHHLTTTAKQPHQWAYTHDRAGYNYRMPGLNAALGRAQLDRLPDLLARKRRLASRYQAAFAGVAGGRIFVEPPYARSNYWLNVLVVDEPADRDQILASTHSNGLLTRPPWTPMHRLPMFAACPRMTLGGAERLADTIVCLPSSARLADAAPAWAERAQTTLAVAASA